MGSIVVVLIFLLAYYGRSVFGNLLGFGVENQYLALSYYYAWWVIPSSIVALIYYKPHFFFKRIGLSNDIYKALKFSFFLYFTYEIELGYHGESCVRWRQC